MGKLVADRLTNSIKNNNMVPQTSNRPNTGYIGELNKIHDTTTPVLLELGFFSNPDELEYICSNQYVNHVSDNMAKEIEKILNEYYK
jgi:N-acetylmuramoyl-L-alanine amidase